jgi:hypothetical protein
VVHLFRKLRRPEYVLGLRLAAGAHLGGLGFEFGLGNAKSHVKGDVAILNDWPVVQEQGRLEELGIEELVGRLR